MILLIKGLRQKKEEKQNSLFSLYTTRIFNAICINLLILTDKGREKKGFSQFYEVEDVYTQKELLEFPPCMIKFKTYIQFNHDGEI